MADQRPVVRSVVHIGPNLLPVPPPRGGAIERKMWSLARAQIGLGVDAQVAAVAVGTPQQPRPHPTVLVVPQESRARFGLEVAWRVARLRPDIVHLHSRPEIAVPLRMLGYRGVVALSFNFPIMLPGVVHHLAGGGYGRGAGLALARFIDVFLPESNYAEDEFRARHGRIPAGRGFVLWNGTDCPEEPPAPRLGRPCAVFVGRFVHQKGADLFAAASTLLPEWDFMAVGPRTEFHRHGSDIPEVHDLGRVQHLGPQPDAVVASLMRDATCLVLPTREWEVFGMVLVEALARGTPVVASDSAGPPEILRGCPGAHFFPPGDLDGLIAAIEEASGDAEDDRLGAQAFAQRFAWPVLAARSIELYEKAQSGRRAGRRFYADSHMGSGSPPRQTVDDPTNALLDRMAHGYVQPSLLAWRAREAALYAQPASGTVIDLGAGYGHFSREVAPNAVAVDLDFDQLRAGLTAGSYAVAVCADISALPFRTASTASVISNCVLEHLRDLPGAVDEARRVLLPLGTLQTTVPLLRINDAYVLRLKRYHDLRNRQLAHRTLLPLDEWREFFAAHGFDVLREEVAVTEGEGRRWDALDAPLFLGIGGRTFFGAYVKLITRFSSTLGAWHRRASTSLARWILNGRKDGDAGICEYLELRPLGTGR